ncbi:MAG: hypothetical protein Q7T71_06705 [Herbiconiux sp.]|nr:hypothetical protein [Herbiconiux sp.]
MRTTSVSARAAAAGAVIVVGLLLGVSGCAAHPTDALSKLAHLDDGTAPSAELDPPVVPGVDDAILPTSLRLLTEADDHAFWVGATRDDRVCFIAEGTDGTRARCLDADRFGGSGARLYLGSPERTYWLHTEYMTVDPGWTSLSSNIAVQD